MELAATDKTVRVATGAELYLRVRCSPVYGRVSARYLAVNKRRLVHLSRSATGYECW